jgi:hypothetical protein
LLPLTKTSVSQGFKWYIVQNADAPETDVNWGIMYDDHHADADTILIVLPIVWSTLSKPFSIPRKHYYQMITANMILVLPVMLIMILYLGQEVLVQHKVLFNKKCAPCRDLPTLQFLSKSHYPFWSYCPFFIKFSKF